MNRTKSDPRERQYKKICNSSLNCIGMAFLLLSAALSATAETQSSTSIPNSQSTTQSPPPRIQIPVGCKLVTGGENGKVVIPDNITLVTGGEDCK